ncbi:MAG: succinate dehydrogenase, cytochrome b556 subunit [Burkholderiales bacterium]|jgi:succinate dehydrogenase / fumarate reductase cytochrome b subunit|nr:succinate dehydrogenase, cytochrome b556 subunit [Burkholderiales bacterium]
MAKAQPSAGRPRPVYLDLLAIRQPIPAVVSFLHRVSGALLFLAGIPLALWGLQASLGSPEAYASFAAIVAHPLAKLAALGLLWATLHHLFAGIRHLFLDLHIGIALAPARRSAAVVLVLALLVTLSIAIRTW